VTEFRSASIAILLLMGALIGSGCIISDESNETGNGNNSPVSRIESIPDDVLKGSAETDLYPPVSHSSDWDDPASMGSPVNTAGAEDSPFITPDGSTFYYFFTPDVGVPAEKQIIDGVSGIWYANRTDAGWSEPERLVLNDDLSLDGCLFVRDDVMWFCSGRVGNYGEIDFYVAEREDGRWTNWRNAGPQLNQEYAIGEMHLSADSQTLYFAWNHSGGQGGVDLWKSARDGDGWGEPVNLGPVVNSERDENQPFISPDGRELWYTGQSAMGYPGPAVYRSSMLEDGSWGPPEEVFSQFAGEPCLDGEGNVYFVHHFFDANMTMVEADIYFARRR
jgi:hypothetical protein